MPWQQLVADVGLEVREDGRLAYREIVISVPRQNGKTTLVLAWELDRAFWWGRQLIIYSAQTGKDARTKLLDDQVPILDGSPFAAAIRKVDRANGREAIIFRSGSRIEVVADSESSGHGKTLGLGVIDEAFKDLDNRREQALKPAMRTVKNSQLIVASTMGTDRSLYLNRKVEGGRKIAEQDREDSRTCYFEWSAGDNDDIEDPETWARCTPALGYTIELETIAAELEEAKATDSVGEFIRASLNRQTHSDERIIAEDVWLKVRKPHIEPEPYVFAVDCNPERSSASICVADREGRVELGAHEPGTGWLVPRVVELARKYKAAVAVDIAGPAGTFAADIAREGVPIVECSGRNLAHACSAFYDAVIEETVTVGGPSAIDVAVASAVRRNSGDAWVWDRKRPLADISPLVAATVALWAATNAPENPDLSMNVW
jgi:hypothetical protein